MSVFHVIGGSSSVTRASRVPAAYRPTLQTNVSIKSSHSTKRIRARNQAKHHSLLTLVPELLQRHPRAKEERHDYMELLTGILLPLRYRDQEHST